MSHKSDQISTNLINFQTNLINVHKSDQFPINLIKFPQTIAPGYCDWNIDGSFWTEIGIVLLKLTIAFAIEVVIFLVIQTFVQINASIGSTSQIVLHTMCVYTHNSTLVYIYI